MHSLSIEKFTTSVFHEILNKIDTNFTFNILAKKTYFLNKRNALYNLFLSFYHNERLGNSDDSAYYENRICR